MSELNKNDFEQIITYYKNKSVELEFQFLILQLNSKKELNDTVSEEVKKAVSDFSEKYSQSLSTIEALKKSLKIVNDKYAALDKKHLKLKEKQNKGS